MESTKAAVLAAFNKYIDSISNTPAPLTVARTLVLGDARRMIRLPDTAPQFYTMTETLDILEDRIRESHDIAETLVPPEAEVWVHNEIAAIWTGSQKSVKGQGALRGVHVFALLHKPGEGWKISGVATAARKFGKDHPPIAADPNSEEGSAVMEPIHKFFAALKETEWDKFEECLHPQLGAVLSRISSSPAILRRPEFIDRLKQILATLPEKSVIEEKIFDVEVRVCGDLGFAWTPFTVEVDGVVKSQGVNIFMMGRDHGSWKAVGLCDTSKPVA
jgi:hypothetical protein